MTKKRVYSHILLDRSHSMHQGYDDTVKAVNSYLEKLAADPDLSTRVSLTLFDSMSGISSGMLGTFGSHSSLATDHVFENIKPKTAPKIGRHNYQPRGNTPLFDAIGSVVAKIDAQTRREGAIVTLVVVADGEENCSVLHTKESIRALLDARKERGWLVIYLGADHDAFAQAGSINVAAVNTMAYNKLNTESATTATLRSVKDYAMTGSIAASAFTNEERDKASGWAPNTASGGAK